MNIRTLDGEIRGLRIRRGTVSGQYDMITAWWLEAVGGPHVVALSWHASEVDARIAAAAHPLRIY